jgi:hypothetical protein
MQFALQFAINLQIATMAVACKWNHELPISASHDEL